MRYKEIRGKAVLGAAAICCFAAMVSSGWAQVGEMPSAFDSSFIESMPNPGEWAGEHAYARSSNGTMYVAYGGHALYMATKGPSDTSWTVQTVDDSYRVGKHNSIALDSNGYPHISYSKYSDNVSLKYARWDGSAWQIETVDGSSITNYAGCNNAIALDSNDRPHIAYIGRKVIPPGPVYTSGTEARNLKYAFFDGTTWQKTTVDADVDISEGTYSSPLSIAVDSTNTPHISYYEYRRWNASIDDFDNLYNLMYVKKNGGTWATADVDADGDSDGRWNSIAVDSNDVPHISYFDDSADDLRYATWNGAVWVNSLVDADGFNHNSIAIGPNDYPQIGYHDETADGVMLAKWDGAVWNTETVFDPNYVNYADLNIDTISIVVNGSNQASLFFSETRYGSKVYSSTWDGSAWQTELVEEGGNLAHRTDIATDKHGFSHVSYRKSWQSRFDDTGQRIEFSALMYGRWDGTNWVTEVVDAPPAMADIPPSKRDPNNRYENHVGIHNAIALDLTGTPHFSYFAKELWYDGATWQYNYRLKYATWDGTAWVSEDLVTAATSDNFPFSSIAVDALGNVHISYFDEANNVLMYITQDATGWKVPEQVDDCGRAGADDECGNWSDLALDSMGNPHISYHDREEGHLLYAYWNGTAWQKTLVDDCGGTEECGKSTSIALDKSNRPHISYRDGGWDDGSPQGTATVRYAYLSGSTWKTQEVDTRVGGGDTSLALGKSGEPHIIYWEGFYKAPKYATTVVYEGTTYWSKVFVEDRRTLWAYEDGDWDEQGPMLGKWNGIAVDNMGRVQFAYSHQATKDMRHAGTLRGPYFPWMMFMPAIVSQSTTQNN